MARRRNNANVAIFAGGMTPDLGQVATGGLDQQRAKLTITSAEDLMNVVLRSDGSIKRRPPMSILGDADIHPSTDEKYWGMTARVFIGRRDDGTIDYKLLRVERNILHIRPLKQTPDTLTSVISVTVTFNLPTSNAINWNKWRIAIENNYIYVMSATAPVSVFKYDPSTGSISKGSTTAYSDIRHPILVTDFESREVESKVVVDSLVFRCIKSHTSASSNEPKGTGDWEDYWQELGHVDHHGTVSAWATSTSYVSNIGEVDLLDNLTANSDKFRAMTFSNGRMWIAGLSTRPNSVFVSQRSTNPLHLRHFFTKNSSNDPDINQVLPTDGGEITIKGAERIIGLYDSMVGLLAMAQNGVWLITGPDNVFSAVNFAVEKISDTGPAGEDSWVGAEHMIIIASDHDIVALNLQAEGNLQKQSLLAGRMQTKWNNISTKNKREAGMLYDNDNNRVILAINDNDDIFTSDSGLFGGSASSETEDDRNHFGQFLHARSAYFLNLNTGGWYRATLGGTTDLEQDGNEVGICNMFQFDMDVKEERVYVETADGYENVLDDTFPLTPKLITATTLNREWHGTSNWTVFQLQAISTTNVYEYFGIFAYDRPIDLAVSHVIDGMDLAGVEIKSQAITHPITFNDIITSKQIGHVFLTMNRVEYGNPTIAGDDLNPGSMRITTAWDWFRPNSGHVRAGTPKEVYRPVRWTQNPYNGALPNKPVVQARHRPRGRGRAIQFMFDNEGGKDFHLHGWQIRILRSQ